MSAKKIKICSACLLGVNCRLDGKNKFNRKVVKLASQEILIPVCPEQLGGLATPREAMEIKKGRVLTESGRDVTAELRAGAKEVLKIAKLFKVKEAILRKKSPSCGYGMIFDGSFSEKMVKGNGITADLLRKNGFKISTEDDL